MRAAVKAGVADAELLVTLLGAEAGQVAAGHGQRDLVVHPALLGQRHQEGDVDQGLLEQRPRVDHLDPEQLEEATKSRVLLPRAFAEQDVVEQELLHHRRHHPVDLRGRPDPAGSRRRRRAAWSAARAVNAI